MKEETEAAVEAKPSPTCSVFDFVATINDAIPTEKFNVVEGPLGTLRYVAHDNDVAVQIAKIARSENATVEEHMVSTGYLVVVSGFLR